MALSNFNAEGPFFMSTKLHKTRNRTSSQSICQSTHKSDKISGHKHTDSEVLIFAEIIYDIYKEKTEKDNRVNGEIISGDK